MSNYVNIKNIEIGKGMPNICIPIMGKTKEALLCEAAEVMNYPCDIVEWRIDHFDAVFNKEVLLDTLQTLYEVLVDKVLLVTFRTSNEGGEKTIDIQTYMEVLESVITSRSLDIIDLECFFDTDAIQHLVSVAQDHQVHVIMSHHNFNETLAHEDIITCFKAMESKGADILKIAMMPTTKEDVLTLMSATLATQHMLNKPLIAMSMGKLGVISRLCGELYGSCVTFGCMDTISAPGQVNAHEVKHMLEVLHLD